MRRAGERVWRRWRGGATRPSRIGLALPLTRGKTRGWTRPKVAMGSLVVALALSLLPALAGAVSALAAAHTARLLPANASCAQLAQADPSATNGALWGATILPGLGQSGGWFGPPVCANGVNQVAPGGANVSCDRRPANFAATGCLPGGATSDGYGLTFQCVEMVARFASWAFGDSPSQWRGDAPYLWLSGNHPASFSAYPNGGTHAPAPGDILVWGTVDSQGRAWPAGPAGGHVAVVAAVGGGSITFVEENMLGHSGGKLVNIPSETTSLTESAGGHWAIGPTYGLNGGRTLYGWLHSSHNTGRFPVGASPTAPPPTAPVTTAPVTTSPITPAPSATAPASSQTPSLAGGVVVTGAGTLAELVWSDSHTPLASSARGAGAHALAESLGAPPGVALAPTQTPAVVALPTGERYIFALGQDGGLYSAYTAPRQPGVFWQTLGAPSGVTLQGDLSARWDRDGMLVTALGSDGAVWLRSGPAGMLGDWATLGGPTGVMLVGAPITLAALPSPAAATKPATTSPTATSSANSTPSTTPTTPTGVVTRLALAIGRDGRLYEADWRPAAAMAGVTAGAATAPGWSDWQVVALPGVSGTQSVSLLSLSAVTGQVAPAQGGAVYALASDAAGRVWLLRRGAMDQSWSSTALRLPAGSNTTLAATLAPAGLGPLSVYLANTTSDAQHNASTTTPSLAPNTQTTPVTSSPTATAAATNPTPISHQNLLVGSFALSGASATMTGDWSALGALSASGSVAALGLRADASALLVAQGGAGLAMRGAAAALSLLAPGATGSVTTAPGTLASPYSFSDSFAGATLDPRWLVTGAATSAQMSAGALSLTAPSGGASPTLALQGVPAGDFTVTTQVTPVGAWPSGAQAGVTLRLDDWNSATLALRADGSLALCGVSRGVAQACQVASAPTGASVKQGAYLRVIQASGTLTAQVSADGVTWAQVGVWSALWLPKPGAFIGAYAPPARASASISATAGATPNGVSGWAPFTSVGLYVSGGGAQFHGIALGSA